MLVYSLIYGTSRLNKTLRYRNYILPGIVFKQISIRALYILNNSKNQRIFSTKTALKTLGEILILTMLKTYNENIVFCSWHPLTEHY